MPFNPTTFQNGPSSATPVDAAALNKLGTQHGLAVTDAVARVAADVADTETAIGSAVSSTIGAASRSAVYQDFTDNSDGALTVTDSGQNWFLATGGGTDAAMRIVGGRMTNAATTAGTTKAGHATVQGLPRPIARMGGVFDFTAGSGTGGTATLVAWASNIVYPGPVPDSATHLTINVLGWTLIHFEDQVGTTISSGVFKTPLVVGTSYLVEWAVSGNTMTITFPDGSSATVTDSRIGSVGRTVPDWETFQSDASTNHRARWSQIWADYEAEDATSRWSSIPRARQIAMQAAKDAAPVAKIWPPVSAGNLNTNVPTTEAEISTDLRLPFVVPSSGRILVRVCAQVLVSTPGGDLRWTLVLPASSKSATLLIAKSVADEHYRTVEHIFEGLTPGNKDEVVWRHRAVAPMAATLRANATANSFCTVSVTPLP